MALHREAGFADMFFPADEPPVGRIDLGPFAVVIDRPGTITSWDLGACSTEATPSPGPSLSAHPASS